MISSVTRVRFAPSPTGYLHIGGLRTALYNFLFARNSNGIFVLRIEDTDRNRYVEGAVENLLNTLNWVGLDYDEGPIKGGDYGPYIQSERSEIYSAHIARLLNSKKVYRCFCTPERLKMVREEQLKITGQGMYDKHCLNLSDEEINQNLKENKPFVFRLNVERNKKVVVHDIIRGDVEFDTNTVDDQVLIKSDGFPTYHFANVVDDHLMKITHVIRGEEWLPSTPKHIILYEYFGWEKPVFAHLPLLLNPDKSKLSKRQGDVAVEDYRAKGYLKEALLNFVALLGWNAGDDKEFYYLDELIEKFSLERVNKAGAVFNPEKLNWLNFEHLRKRPDQETVKELRELLDQHGLNGFDDAYLLKVIAAMKERVTFVREYIEKGIYLFKAPEKYDENTIKKRWKEKSPELLAKYLDKIKSSGNLSKENYEELLRLTAEENQVGAGQIIHPLRIAVSGVGEGPGVFDILNIIGKEESVKRIERAIKTISK
ncbi:MAG: glutamate--tRNA ligase [Ignavibacteriaceae bacterium]